VFLLGPKIGELRNTQLSTECVTKNCCCISYNFLSQWKNINTLDWFGRCSFWILSEKPSDLSQVFLYSPKSLQSLQDSAPIWPRPLPFESFPVYCLSNRSTLYGPDTAIEFYRRQRESQWREWSVRNPATLTAMHHRHNHLEKNQFRHVACINLAYSLKQQTDCNVRKSKAFLVTGHGGLQDFETPRIPHFLDSRFTDGSEVSCPLLPTKIFFFYFWYSFMLEAELTQGHRAAGRITYIEKNNSMTPSGM
jgi:hypothetical protein